VCFASGFAEADAETGDGAALQARLLAVAGRMPILGPNCYGFINALDRAALWPDQHGLVPVERGVALVGQSSNMLINLTMQRRGLPISHVVAAGNQAQLGLAAIGRALLADDRVTALGLHIEGLGDPSAFEALARAARAVGKPVVALKVGASAEAQTATLSHTASLVGSAAGAAALFARLGVAQVHDLASFLEALKLAHGLGRLPAASLASMSCSGGEASLMADMAAARGIAFPALTEGQRARLREVLGPKVALSNPLDYHTYIWGDTEAMAETFAAMLAGPAALGCLIVDYPRADRCDASAWAPVIEAAARARAASACPLALLATLPENMPEEIAAEAFARGLVPLAGLAEALDAIAALARAGGAPEAPAPAFAPPEPAGGRVTLSEAEAKAALADHGLAVPAGRRAASAAQAREAAEALGFPVVLKAEGIAHKTEAGAVRLGLTSGAEVEAAARAMGAGSFLVERMVEGAVAELVLGITRDPAHGFLLTIGAGGQLAELLADTATLIVPAGRAEILAALSRLRIWRLLAGWRGAPAGNIEAVADAALALQDFVIAAEGRVVEAEINPLIVTPERAVAADALVVRIESEGEGADG
jgi:acyl-CoA synthetase (NDP forming)